MAAGNWVAGNRLPVLARGAAQQMSASRSEGVLRWRGSVHAVTKLVLHRVCDNHGCTLAGPLATPPRSVAAEGSFRGVQQRLELLLAISRKHVGRHHIANDHNPSGSVASAVPGMANP